MDLQSLVESKIVVDKDICSGKPRIKGTRTTVADILLALAEGMSEVEVLRNFRSIHGQDIKAAIAYAYCVADKRQLKLKSSFGDSVFDTQEEAIKHQEFNQMAAEVFAKSLETEAVKQEKITQEKIEELQRKKAETAEPRMEAPEVKPYDLEINIPADQSIVFFSTADSREQGLDMKVENYIFELREDNESWLTYSVKDGVEIDKAMRRTLKLNYFKAGQECEGIFDGYLTNDRLHKVFIVKKDNGFPTGVAV